MDFLCNAEFKSLLGTFGIYPDTYSLGLFAGLFKDAMVYCLPVVSCEMTRIKKLVLKDLITLDPLRMMGYRVSKASTVSIITAFTRPQLSIDIFFSLLSMKYDIEIQNAAISRFPRENPTFEDTVFFERRFCFLAVCLTK